MFTGLIQDVGTISRIERHGSGAKFWLKTKLDASSFSPGESIAVDGVCLTAAETRRDEFRADVSPESLARSTLGDAAVGKNINIERAMQIGDRFGGHFVLGHVDGVCAARAIGRDGEYLRVTIAAPPEIIKYAVAKGSIAINGVSLTINDVTSDSFSMMLIPTTLNETNLSMLKPGDKVNIETDIIGKYVEKFVTARSGGLSIEKLREEGFR